jgi:uncharacterized delta-60 repeat protein
MRPIAAATGLALAMTLAETPLAAQVGELDPDFSGDGRATWAPIGDFADAFAARADGVGRVVVVGNSREGTGNDTNTDFLIARFLDDGERDLGFGDGGRQRVGFDLEGRGSDYADAVWLRPDGRILVHGLAQNDPFDNVRRTPALVQLTADGDLDPTFSGDGKLVLLFPDQGHTAGSSATAILPAAGGAVWVTNLCYDCTGDGRRRLSLARVLVNGTLDTSFGTDGWLLVEPPATIASGNWYFADWARTADGKLWAAVGNDAGVTGLLRLTAQGVPDPGWGPGGWVVTDHGSQGSSTFIDFVRAFAVDGRGRPVVSWMIDSGTEDQYGRIYRWTPTGGLDASFGSAGGVTLELGGEVSISGLVPQGRELLLVGAAETDFQNGAYDFLAVRYKENGQLDPAFGGNGLTYVDFDIPGPTTHDFAMDLALVAGRPVLVGTAWERELDLGAGPLGETNGTRWALARLDNDWIFADGFDQGGTANWSLAVP